MELIVRIMGFWIGIALIGMIFSIPFDLHLDEHPKHKTRKEEVKKDNRR